LSRKNRLLKELEFIQEELIKEKQKKEEEDRYNKGIHVVIKPKSPNQQLFMRTILTNEITVCMGPAGSGKGAISVGMGVQQLVSGAVKRLVITRPVVEAGENLGFLPGNLLEKLDPYLQPIYYEICKHIPQKLMYEYIGNGENKTGEKEICIVPFAFMRGLSFHDSYIVADELQNASFEQIKMLLTRLGMGSRLILLGDDKQSDLKPACQGGLCRWWDILDGIEGIGHVRLQKEDIVRNPIISRILERLGE
jgi:phosphate starvation-inducible PhoH-like protein